MCQSIIEKALYFSVFRVSFKICREKSFSPFHKKLINKETRMFNKLIAVLYTASMIWIFIPESIGINSELFASFILLILNVGLFLAIIVSANLASNKATRIYFTTIYITSLVIHTFTIARIQLGYAVEFEALIYMILPATLFIGLCIGQIFPKD